jgi:O-antigen/teichoic acid export membrane protein
MNLSLRAKNFIAVLSSNFGVQALRFLTITLLARRLGSGLFGVYNYIILLVSYGCILTEFGLRNLGIREFAQDRGSRKLIRQIFKIRMIHAAAAMGAVLGLTALAFSSGQYFWPSFFIAASLVMDALFVDFILVARESLVPISVGNLAQAAILLVGCFIFIHSPNQFMLLGELYFVSHVVWAAVYYLGARPFWPKLQRMPSDGKTWRTAMSGAPFMVALLATNFQNSMDLLLLGQFHYGDLLGIYSAAIKIIGMALGVVYSLIASVQPRLARDSTDLNSPELKELVSSTTRFLWLFIAPTVVGCWLFGDQLVTWVFGPAYSEAAQFVKPLSLSFAFLSLAMAPLTTLLVSSHTKAMLKVVCFNCLISFALIGGLLLWKRPMLIPWGMVVAQALLMITCWGWFGTLDIITWEELRFLPLPVLLLAAPLLLHVPPVIKFSLAAFGYLLGLAVLRIWNRPWFSRVLGKAS